MERPIKIRDFRNKQFFMVDDAYLNGYAKYLGVTASMIYICLCRHVDKNQVAFPSQKSIADKLGIKQRTVLEKVKLLKNWGLIDVRQIRNENGKWINNTYILLDKTEWKNIPSVEKEHTDSPCVEKLHSPSAVSQQHKDTHNKDTHTLSIERFSKISSLGEKEFEKISKRYDLPISFVRSKYDDLINWHESTGKVKKNWYATLANWVKRDGMKLRKEEVSGKRRISFIDPA